MPKPSPLDFHFHSTKAELHNKNQRVREKERLTDRSSIIWVTAQMVAIWGLKWARLRSGTRSFVKVQTGWECGHRSPSIWGYPPLLYPGIWDCGHHRWQLNVLCHNTGPCFILCHSFLHWCLCVFFSFVVKYLRSFLISFCVYSVIILLMPAMGTTFNILKPELIIWNYSNLILIPYNCSYIAPSKPL